MRRGVPVVLATAVVLAAGPALAFVVSPSSAVSVPVRTDTAPAVPRPSLVAQGRDLAVAVPTSTYRDGARPAGYTVRRYAASGRAPAVQSVQCGTTPGACVLPAVPPGKWAATAAVEDRGWHGAESPSSVTVTVDPPALAAPTSLPPAVAVPVTVSSFLTGEHVQVHLGSAAGVAVSASVVVPPGGATPVSVALPTGTPTGRTALVAVASPSGEQASATTTVVSDATAPLLTSLSAADVDADGRLDTVTATFDETLQPSADASPWSVTGLAAAVTGISTKGSVATLRLSGAPVGTATAPVRVALTAASTGIRDAAGNAAAFGPTQPADAAAPVLTRLTLEDADANGRVDTVHVTASEPLPSTAVRLSSFRLRNVPSGGGLNRVETLSGSPVVTLGLTEGPGAPDTSTAGMTVQLTADPTGLRDSAGNPLAFAATAPQDAAAPVVLRRTLTDPDARGEFQQLRLDLSEPAVAGSTASASVVLGGAPALVPTSRVVAVGTAVYVDLQPALPPGTRTTAVGTVTVAVLASPTGLVDAAGNRVAATPAAPVDGAGPVLYATSVSGGTTRGLPQAGDSLLLTFSEAVVGLPTTTSAAWTDGGRKNDTLDLPGVLVSPVDLGTTTALVPAKKDRGTAVFSVVLDQPAPDQVRVRLVACSGACSALQAVASSVDLRPAATLSDAAANPSRGGVPTALF